MSTVYTAIITNSLVWRPSGWALGPMQRLLGGSGPRLTATLSGPMTVQVTVVKFGAFLVTGSASMLSEAVHSMGDSLNQTLLAIGIRVGVPSA